MTCKIHTDKCSPKLHSPGGEDRGTAPFRPGKTQRDKNSGAWAQRLANRANRAEKNRNG